MSWIPRRHRYWIGSSLLFAGSLCTSSTFFPFLTGCVALYNVSSVLNLIEVNRFKDMEKREFVLTELLRMHMFQCENLRPYVRPDSLYIEMETLKFEDQGLMGALWSEGKPAWLSEFTMKAYWKDVRALGEGSLEAEGTFVSLTDYRFNSILAHVRAPESRQIRVLDSDFIEV